MADTPTEITVFTKDRGLLTKRISLAGDGSVSADGSACVMTRGTAQRVRADHAAELARVIEGLGSSQAIAVGSLRAGLPDKVTVGTKAKLNGSTAPDIIARTATDIVYRENCPAWAPIDFDAKGMPADIAARVANAGGFWSTLVSVLPALAAAARVTRASTSAGLYRADTGEQFPGTGGMHAFLAVRDGSDVERFLHALHDRCWLAGFGWYWISAGGHPLERSIVDRVVGGPERLVFEGPPEIVPPLAQDTERRRPIAAEGDLLDTRAVCPTLTLAEEAKLEELRKRLGKKVKHKAAKVRRAFIKQHGERLAGRAGMSAQAAAYIIARQCDRVLLPVLELPFDDEEFAGCTVANVLADPERFETATLADPIEGIGYGRCKAKVLLRGDGTPVIHSFAHGGMVYELKDEPIERAELRELNLDQDPVAAAKDLAGLIRARRGILLNGYAPVRVVQEADQDPHAIELGVDALRVYAYEICRCTKTEKDRKVEVPLSRDVAGLYLAGLEGQWGLRPLRGISTTPLLQADGTIRTADGYDEASGLWCHNVPTVRVPDRPTKDDAHRALLTLRQAFSTFPFGDAILVPDAARGVDVLDLAYPPQLDESIHLAALLTSVCRPCLTLAPGFLYNAAATSGAGTGKGLLLKSTCVVGSGVQPTATTAGHDEQELDKRLVSAAIAARPAIYLDNFNGGQLKSDTLASFLTEYPAMVRVLGQSKMVPVFTRTLIVITGNAVTISEDMARRVFDIELDARMEHPEQRPFAPGFLDGVRQRRPELLSACLTIWRWGVQQGDALRRGKPIGSYEEWARWCRDPLLALGCRDPIDRIAEIKMADPQRRQIADVFARWWEHHADKPVGATDLHESVKEAIDPNARRTLDDGLTYSRQKVQAFLRKHVKTRVAGYVLQETTPAISANKNSYARYLLTRNE